MTGFRILTLLYAGLLTVVVSWFCLFPVSRPVSVTTPYIFYITTIRERQDKIEKRDSSYDSYFAISEKRDQNEMPDVFRLSALE
jgi:hypothetical protein